MRVKACKEIYVSIGGDESTFLILETCFSRKEFVITIVMSSEAAGASVSVTVCVLENQEEEGGGGGWRVKGGMGR